MNLYKVSGYSTIAAAPLLFIWDLVRYDEVRILPLLLYLFLIIQGIKLLKKTYTPKNRQHRNK